MILILTCPDDEHGAHVQQLLRARGVDCVVFDPADFPRHAQITVRYGVAGIEGFLTTRERRIALVDVSAVWYRRPGRPTVGNEIKDAEIRAFVRQECRDFVRDVWHCTESAWVPAKPAVVERGYHKPQQLALAANHGFEIPATVITNDPKELIEFYRVHDRNIVCKLAGLSFGDQLGRRFWRYTEPVRLRDLGYAKTLRHCPAIFQAYVPKRVELRVTVVGARVFAAEIHSQKNHHTKHDWRKYDLGRTPHFTHALPADIAARCVLLTRTLGISYAAIDFIVTPDGRYVFVEVNPNGQYLWIEQLTGLPISEALCDLLTGVTHEPELAARC